jgi:hypothetical protein
MCRVWRHLSEPELVGLKVREDSSAITILVVEDERKTADTIRRYLEHAVYDVVVCWMARTCCYRSRHISRRGGAGPATRAGPSETVASTGEGVAATAGRSTSWSRL